MKSNDRTISENTVDYDILRIIKIYIDYDIHIISMPDVFPWCVPQKQKVAPLLYIRSYTATIFAPARAGYNIAGYNS